MIPSLFHLQVLARSNPWLLKMAWRHREFIPMMRRHEGQRRVVEPGDDLLIEGYFRSANTFAVESFAACQAKAVKIAHHFHSPAQFALARNYGVPAMLLLREPVAAALSYVVFTEGTWSPYKALKFYVGFHRPLVPMRQDFLVAPFDEVTQNFGATIARLNRRFGADFKLFNHTAEAQEGVFAGISRRMNKRGAETGLNMEVRMNFPNEAKAQLRSQMKHSFQDPRLNKVKAEAQELYEHLMTLA